MKKVVFVSHCLLNYTFLPDEHSITIAKGIINSLLDENVGIVQIPCPSPHDCKKVSEKVLKKAKMYLKDGINVLGIISKEFSPICGVHKIRKEGRIVPGKGILIKEMEDGMRKQKFQIPIIPANLNNGFTTLKKLKKLLKSV